MVRTRFEASIHDGTLVADAALDDCAAHDVVLASSGIAVIDGLVGRTPMLADAATGSVTCPVMVTETARMLGRPNAYEAVAAALGGPIVPTARVFVLDVRVALNVRGHDGVVRAPAGHVVLVDAAFLVVTTALGPAGDEGAEGLTLKARPMDDARFLRAIAGIAIFGDALQADGAGRVVEGSRSPSAMGDTV